MRIIRSNNKIRSKSLGCVSGKMSLYYTPKFYGFISAYQWNFMNETKYNWLAYVAGWMFRRRITRPIIHILYTSYDTASTGKIFHFPKTQAIRAILFELDMCIYIAKIASFFSTSILYSAKRKLISNNALPHIDTFTSYQNARIKSQWIFR